MPCWRRRAPALASGCRLPSIDLNLCLHTDSVAELSFAAALDFAAEIGIECVEIAAGGQSAAPHMQLEDLLADHDRRARFDAAIARRGLTLAAINCSAWPLHPTRGERDLKLVRDAIRLAGELGVETIVTMSGCPGDSTVARTPNWIVSPWPPELAEIRERQWRIAIETWSEVADFAKAHGVHRIAMELHPMQLVYNVPTLQRMRRAVGPVIGANLDPSHLFWQGMDPVRVARTLHAAIYHVHLKDTEIYEAQVALNGVLDPRSWSDPSQRSWSFRTIGHGHPASFWAEFFDALRVAGYDGVLSIENEDQVLPGKDGVVEAMSFLRPRPGDPAHALVPG